MYSSPPKTSDRQGPRLPSAARTDRRHVLLAAAAFLVVAAWYLVNLDRAGFWLDEISSARSVQQPYAAMLSERMDAGHGPVYFSLLWLIQQAGGSSEFLLRLPALVFGLGTVVLVYLLLAPRAGGAVASLAALLALTNPVLVYLATQARPYTLAAFLCLLLSRELLRAQEGRDGPVAARIAVLSLLCLGTHYATAFVLAGMALYLLMSRPRRWRLLGAMGVGAVICAPWFLAFLSRKADPLEQVAWWSEPSVTDVALLPFRLLALAPREIGADTTLAWGRFLMSFGLVVLAIRGARRLGALGRYWVTIWAMPPLAMLLLMVAGIWASPFSVHRYFIVPAVAQTALISAGALGIGRSRLTAALVPAALVAVSLGVVVTVFRVWPFPDYRPVARQLGSDGVPECRVTVIERHMPVPDYYLSRSGIPYDAIDAESVEVSPQGVDVPTAEAPPTRHCVVMPTYIEERFGIVPDQGAVSLLGAEYRFADRIEKGAVAIYMPGAD